jgi:hypothetical protein
MSESASPIALDLMERLEAVTRLQPDPPAEIARNLSNPEVQAALDRSMGNGAADLLGKVSLNIGVVEGGLKTNMIPSECRVEADIRIPFGLSKADVLACVHEILRDFPQVSVAEESVESETHANWCDPDGEMLRIIQGNALKVRGIKPVPIATLALTDTRWWRNAGSLPTSTAARRMAWRATTNPSASRNSCMCCGCTPFRRRLSGRRMMNALEQALLERLKASEAKSVAFHRRCARHRPTRSATRVPRPRSARSTRARSACPPSSPRAKTCPTSSPASMPPAPAGTWC